MVSTQKQVPFVGEKGEKVELIIPVAIAIIIAHLSMRYYKEIWGVAFVMVKVISPVLLYIACIAAMLIISKVVQ